MPGFSPDEPLGTEATGTTPVEQDAGESIAQRSSHRRPGTVAGSARTDESEPPAAADEPALHVEPTPDVDEPVEVSPQTTPKGSGDTDGR